MSDNNSGGIGCLPLILFGFLIWALLFGLTVDGKHYGVSCNCADGVKVSK